MNGFRKRESGKKDYRLSWMVPLLEKGTGKGDVVSE